MDSSRPFCYRPACSAAECRRPASYKVAAAWSDGTSRELKNYGLACDTHRESQLTAAQGRLKNLKLSDGESVGPVALYVLRPDCRDTELVAVGLNDVPACVDQNAQSERANLAPY